MTSVIPVFCRYCLLNSSRLVSTLEVYLIFTRGAAVIVLRPLAENKSLIKVPASEVAVLILTVDAVGIPLSGDSLPFDLLVPGFCRELKVSLKTSATIFSFQIPVLDLVETVPVAALAFTDSLFYGLWQPFFGYVYKN